jgi:hypothetical protein
MLREIRKKLIILNNRSPFRQEVKDYLADLEYREWLYMNMSLSGKGLSAEEIDMILGGGCIMDAAVEDYLMLDRLEELRQYIYHLTDLDADLSLQILRDMQAIITGVRCDGDADAVQRLLYFADCIASEKSGADNPLEKAAVMHNLTVNLQPFDGECTMLARAVMYYVLAQAGYPLAALELTMQEYRQMNASFLTSKDSSRLVQSLGQAVSKRLDLMMQLTRHEN